MATIAGRIKPKYGASVATDFGPILQLSEGGIVATHEPGNAGELFVGPSTQDEANAVRGSIFPIACFRVEDVRFGFDSSFVKPSIKKEMTLLTELRQRHPKAPLSIFGHADPVSNDDYNKSLSGRRAMAIYGLLIRDTNIWEELFSNPVGGDNWGANALTEMVSETQGGPADIKPFQRSKADRQQLFADYMDALCGPDLKLEKTDFLGRGEDKGGKADFQGCSEFNPVRIFSAQDQQTFERSKDHTERNKANAPNRRVMVLLFREGTRINPARWPCPRAKEGTAACKKRFWSDGESRRTRREPDESREFDQTKDTFACRFYQRLATGSPCEERLLPAFGFWDEPLVEPEPGEIATTSDPSQIPKDPGGRTVTVQELRFRLLDRQGKPIDKGNFLALLPGGNLQGTTNSDGEVLFEDVDVPERFTIKWNKSGSDPNRFEFEREVFAEAAVADQREASRRRLSNLGFFLGKTLEDNVKAFQKALGVAAERLTGRHEDIADELVRHHDDLAEPPRQSQETAAAEEGAGTHLVTAEKSSTGAA